MEVSRETYRLFMEDLVRDGLVTGHEWDDCQSCVEELANDCCACLGHDWDKYRGQCDRCGDMR